ncbi:diacylglycerol kinase family lipid kinase [Bacillus sp. ISL-47]|uniref:diacylglycerol/lipid kinase family protein n=1 Tax=Bacillus sp. ISL-47 TaxID=2819130 RepID=UPI001BE90B95|nr:diacylglycerol kinase family protein [Bacillus sp. ISL-47]MBT2690513.1 diacylglycerol kinase family lipid kinase [Bacillus sp. ISL-47]MBT2709405.1 diacylglycerol kinase family lipid kinase [Pseudomonas sp. ISL-84]
MKPPLQQRTDKMRPTIFIINPQAKNGYCQKVWRKVEQVLQHENVPYSASRTEYRGHAKEMAEYYAEQACGQRLSIIAVGGDGTLHEVINGTAMYPNVTVGFIPGGSGNDFSRGFGVPKDPVAALIAILKGKDVETVRTDIGMVRHTGKNETYFINNMGAGFDAQISEKVNRSKMKGILNRLSLGKFVYALFLIKELFVYKCSTLEIEVDGRKQSFHSAWFVTVSNQPFYGGGMKISPDANPFDGILNLTIVHNISKFKLLFVFASVFKGKHVAFKEVAFLQGKTIRIRSSHPIPAHADGEPLGCTPLTVSVCRNELPVILKKRK